MCDNFINYVIPLTLSCETLLCHEKRGKSFQSHASLTIRFGAIIFGLGTLIYMVLEFVSLLEIEAGSPCHYPILGANVVLSILMVILQTYLIFVLPRLNLHIWGLIDRYMIHLSL